jgi:hypothetical protein
MILFLLIFLKYTAAIDWNPVEKEAVDRLSESASEAVMGDIHRKADQMFKKFEKIVHPLQKRELNKNSSRIKQAISDHLYREYGTPVIQKIPSIIKDSIEKSSDDLDLLSNPSEYQLSYQQAEKLADQISLDMTQRTQSNLMKNVNSKWQAFEKATREKASREQGLVNYGNSLGKRDFLDKVRQKYKFFQIDPTTQSWIPVVISLVIMLFSFAVFLPGMTLSYGIWQTILQFAFIQPIINKLFLGYYFYDNGANHTVPEKINSN